VRSSDPNVKAELPKVIPARGETTLVITPDWDKITKPTTAEIRVDLADPPGVTWTVSLDMEPPAADRGTAKNEQILKRINSLESELRDLRNGLKSPGSKPPSEADEKPKGPRRN